MQVTTGHDFGQRLIGLYDKLVTAQGLKLSLDTSDTCIIIDGRIVSWYHTSKDGVFTKVADHEITSFAVLQQITNVQVCDPLINPYGYCAVARYSNGRVCLCSRSDLEHLMDFVAGPFETASTVKVDLPYCIQAYVPPYNDARFIVTYLTGTYPSMTTFKRRFSNHLSTYLGRTGEFFKDGVTAPNTAHKQKGIQTTFSRADDSDLVENSVADLVAEARLVAKGIVEPRDLSRNASNPAPKDKASAEAAAKDTVLPVAPEIEASIGATLARIIRFAAKAHSTRLTGLVAEFISSPGGKLLLLTVHAVEFGGPTVNTGKSDRWAEFVTGLGCPFAPTPSPVKKNQSLSRAASSAVGISSQHSAQPTIIENASFVLMHQSSMPERSTAVAHSEKQARNRQPQRPKTSPVYSSQYKGRAAATAEPHAMASPPVQCAVSAPNSPSPGERTKANSQTFANRPPQLDVTPPINPSWSANNAPKQPALASKQYVQSTGCPSPELPSSPVPRRVSQASVSYSVPASPSKASMSPVLEGAVSPRSRRPSHVSFPESPDPLLLSLEDDLELVLQALDRQVRTRQRYEAALFGLALSSGHLRSLLATQCEEMVAQIEDARRRRIEAEAEADRLRSERGGLAQRMEQLQTEVAKLAASVASNRETLTVALKSQEQRENTLTQELFATRNQHTMLQYTVDNLKERVTEEGDIIEIARRQLVEEKNKVLNLQSQIRLTKTRSAQGTSMPSMSMPGTSIPGTSMPGTPGGGVDLSASLPIGGFSSGKPLKDWGALASNALQTSASSNSPVVRWDAGVKGGDDSTVSSPRSTVTNKRYSRTYGNIYDDRSEGPEPCASPLMSPSTPLILSRPTSAFSHFSTLQIPTASLEALAPDPNHPLAAIRRAKLESMAEHNPLTYVPHGTAPQVSDEANGQPSLAGVAAMAAATNEAQTRMLRNIALFEELRIVDLFPVPEGESLSTEQLDLYDAVAAVIRSSSRRLYEVFCYYCYLEKQLLVRNKLAMTYHQYLRFAEETGVSDNEQHKSDVEDVWRILKERRHLVDGADEDDESSKAPDHLTWATFPEMTVRLATVRYDWRPPDPREEDEGEVCIIPPSLAANGLVSVSSKDEDREHEPDLASVVKRYLIQDVLPCARRNRLAGSMHARDRSGSAYLQRIKSATTYWKT